MRYINYQNKSYVPNKFTVVYLMHSVGPNKTDYQMNTSLFNIKKKSK